MTKGSWLAQKRAWIWALAAPLFVFAVAINVVNRFDTDVPPPLWTPDALPEPAADDNGWPDIAHYHATTISGIDLQPLDNLLAATRDHPLPELGRVFAPARVVASKIRAHTQVCADAFAKERMVITCLALEEGTCTAEALEICTRIATFAALDRASRGAPSGVVMMANVVARLRDAAANSPHPWVQGRVLVLLRASIHHAAALIKWRRGHTQPLRDAVAAVSEESLPLVNLAIANYLLKHLALREAMDKSDTWLLDEGAVLEGLNEPFEKAKRGLDLPPPVNHTQGWFWWFDNPIGKKMLDAVRPGADDGYVRVRDLRATVLQRREETLRLGAAPIGR